MQWCESRQAGCGCRGVPAERARLVHRSCRGEQVHDVGATAHGGERQAAADDLPEGEQVRRPALLATLDPPPAVGAHAEARHHLVEHEQRPVGIRRAPQVLVEPGRRGHHAHVRGCGLGDDGGDLVAAFGKQRVDRCRVAVRQHHRLGSRRSRDAGRVGQAERGDARAGRSQHRVRVTVVAAGELDDQGPVGLRTSQAQGGHDRLGAGAREAHPLDGLDPSHDLLGEQHLVGARRAERRRRGGRRGDRLDDGGVGVPEDHGPPGADEVDVLTAVDVPDP